MLGSRSEVRAAQISGCSKTRENTQNRVQRFYIHTNLIKFVIAHFKLENRSMSCTFQLICIASLLAFSTFILVFMQNCRDCRFSNSEMTPMLPLNTDRINMRNFFFHLYKCGKLFHLYRFRINEIISAKILKSRIKFI